MNKKQIVTLDPIRPGTCIAVPNSRGMFVVIARVRPRIYSVRRPDGRVIEMERRPAWRPWVDNPTTTPATWVNAKQIPL